MSNVTSIKAKTINNNIEHQQYLLNILEHKYGKAVEAMHTISELNAHAERAIIAMCNIADVSKKASYEAQAEQMYIAASSLENEFMFIFTDYPKFIERKKKQIADLKAKL